MEDQQFLATVLKMLVNNPEKVKIKRLVNDKGVLLEVDVDPADLGSLIGKQGKNISALRHLVRMIGLQNRAYVSIRLNQPER